MTQHLLTQQAGMQTSTTQGRSPSRVLATGIAVVVVVAVAVVVAALAQPGISGASTPSTEAQFGCQGTMVIANVDCALGGADAFGPAAVDAKANAGLGLSGDRAPWCGPNHDVTIYGCSMDRHKLDRSCGHLVSAATAAMASSGQTAGCESSLWLDALVLGEGVLDAPVLQGSDESQSDLCQGLTDPPDACGPFHQGPCPEGQEFRRSTVS